MVWLQSRPKPTLRPWTCWTRVVAACSPSRRRRRVLSIAVDMLGALRGVPAAARHARRAARGMRAADEAARFRQLVAEKGGVHQEPRFPFGSPEGRADLGDPAPQWNDRFAREDRLTARPHVVAPHEQRALHAIASSHLELDLDPRFSSRTARQEPRGTF